MLGHSSCVRLFATLCTVAYQVLLSMGILQVRILEWLVLASESERGAGNTCLSPAASQHDSPDSRLRFQLSPSPALSGSAQCSPSRTEQRRQSIRRSGQEHADNNLRLEAGEVSTLWAGLLTCPALTCPCGFYSLHAGQAPALSVPGARGAAQLEGSLLFPGPGICTYSLRSSSQL